MLINISFINDLKYIIISRGCHRYIVICYNVVGIMKPVLSETTWLRAHLRNTWLADSRKILPDYQRQHPMVPNIRFFLFSVYSQLAGAVSQVQGIPDPFSLQILFCVRLSTFYSFFEPDKKFVSS